MKFTIKGTLDGLNEYTSYCRVNKYAGAKSKKSNNIYCQLQIMNNHLKPVQNYPVTIDIKWYEKSNKRDADNVAFAKKFILDALVNAGILENDSRRFVVGFSDYVLMDKDNPRIEVTINERSKDD